MALTLLIFIVKKDTQSSRALGRVHAQANVSCLYTRYPIVAFSLPAAVQPLGRVLRASKGNLHTSILHTTIFNILGRNPGSQFYEIINKAWEVAEYFVFNSIKHFCRHVTSLFIFKLISDIRYFFGATLIFARTCYFIYSITKIFSQIPIKRLISWRTLMSII